MDALFSGPALDRQAQLVMSAPGTRPMDWFDKVAEGIFWGGEAADAATTIYGLAHGYQEGNPLTRWAGPKASLPLALGMDITAYLVAKKALKDHPNWLRAGLIGLGASHAIAAGMNLRTLAKYGAHP